MSRRPLSFIGVLLVNLVVFLVILELAALAYFGLRDGHFYYTARGAIVRDRAAEIASGLRDADSEHLRRALHEGLSQSKFRLSPYYGFNVVPHDKVPEENPQQRLLAARNCTYRVNVLCEGDRVYYVTNNYGFDSVLDYPYRKKSDDEFVIGVFGDSVALNLVKTTMPELFDDILAPLPQLRGKKIIVLSFAREGFKEPQQLETLAYFLSIGQTFDVVVNLDGVSAVVHALVNSRQGVDYSMPSVGQIGYLLDLFSAAIYQGTTRERLLDFYFWKHVREWMLQRMAQAPLAGLAAVLDAGFGIAGRLEANARKAAAAPDLSRVVDQPVFLLPQRNDTSAEEVVAESIEEWRRSSLLMAGMLHGFGIPYLQILEPNQYYSKKPFSEAERRVALGLDKWYARPSHDGYALLVKDGDSLRKEGVDFVSAVDLYDDIAEPIYIDDCCHTNRKGALLLARFIAAHLPAGP